jgi:hypothetical protein
MNDLGLRPADPEVAGPSTLTVVWGLLLLGVAISCGLRLVDVSLDPVLVVAGLMLAGGLLLVVSAAFGGRRRARPRRR